MIVRVEYKSIKIEPPMLGNTQLHWDRHEHWGEAHHTVIPQSALVSTSDLEQGTIPTDRPHNIIGMPPAVAQRAVALHAQAQNQLSNDLLEAVLDADIAALPREVQQARLHFQNQPK